MVAQGGGFAEPWVNAAQKRESPGGAKEPVVPPGLHHFGFDIYPRVPQSLHPGLPSVAAPRLRLLDLNGCRSATDLFDLHSCRSAAASSRLVRLPRLRLVSPSICRWRSGRGIA